MNDLNDLQYTERALAVRPVAEMTFSDQIQIDIQLAQLMCKSKLMLPSHFHNAPAECLGIVRISRLWNMDPYMVAQKTSIINNRLMYEGQLINAAINNSGALAERLRFTFEGAGDTRTCTASGRLRSEQAPREVTVGMPHGTQAKNSPLWKGSQEDKDQQLTYKAARTWSRRHAPELTLGVYAAEDDWSAEEPEAKAVNDANQRAVQNRVAALETSPAKDVDVTDVDFFNEELTPKVAVENTFVQKNPEKEIIKRNISDSPEDRLEHPNFDPTYGGQYNPESGDIIQPKKQDEEDEFNF